MAVRKIKAGRVSTVTLDQFIGEQGTIFYDDVTGEIRLANGTTAGGQLTLLIPGSNATGPTGDGGNAGGGFYMLASLDGGRA